MLGGSLVNRMLGAPLPHADGDDAATRAATHGITASFDAATGLPARSELIAEMLQHIDHSMRCALPFDVCQVVLVGAPAADARFDDAMRALVARLRRMQVSTDYMARLDRSTLVMLRDRRSAQETAEPLRASLAQTLQAPFETGGAQFEAQAGVAEYPHEGLNPLRLLQAAARDWLSHTCLAPPAAALPQAA